MKVIKLTDAMASEYDLFVRKFDHIGVFYSNKYRLMLKEFIKADDNYFILKNEDDEINAVLPAFILRNEEYGSVLNSLPYYGSNGGVLSKAIDDESKKQLITAFDQFAKENNCISTTIITSPFEEHNEFYESVTGYEYKDERIGQITILPQTSAAIQEDLMSSFHQKTRNMVRKSEKSRLKVTQDYSDEVFEFLIKGHKDNIESLGGLAKGKEFFDSLQRNLKYGEDYQIFAVTFEGKFISALLLLYFNLTVEYFTPVIVSEYRNLQPLSLLIFRSMIDACNKGFRYWNWGGTWLTQKGVYLFKSRWSTVDKNYYYYTKLLNKEVLNYSKQFLLDNYRYFYVLPFDVLNN